MRAIALVRHATDMHQHMLVGDPRQLDSEGTPHLSFSVVFPGNQCRNVAFCYVGNQTKEMVSYALKIIVQHCKDVRLAVWCTRYAICGVQARCRPLQGRLQRAWGALGAWQQQVPVSNRVPMPALAPTLMPCLDARHPMLNT